MYKNLKRLTGTLLLLFITGFATPSIADQTDQEADQIEQANSTSVASITATNKDPYQRFNRAAFDLNRTTDKVIFKPVAIVYKTILPDIAQTGVKNFFNNFDYAPVIVNDFLQFKVYQGAQDTWRFFFNSTFGILGLFDVASKIGLPAHENDFGMTLATWGYHNSNYFIIPFLGPSTIRDTMSLGVDYEFLTFYPYVKNVPVRYSMLATDFVQRRAQLLQYQDLIDQASVDPYVFQRDAYMQKRINTINDQTASAKDPNHVNDHNDDPFVEL